MSFSESASPRAAGRGSSCSYGRGEAHAQGSVEGHHRIVFHWQLGVPKKQSSRNRDWICPSAVCHPAHDAVPPPESQRRWNACLQIDTTQWLSHQGTAEVHHNVMTHIVVALQSSTAPHQMCAKGTVDLDTPARRPRASGERLWHRKSHDEQTR